MFGQFKTRLVVIFMALFAAAQLLTFFAVHGIVRRNFVSQANAQLLHARDIFERHLARQENELAEASRVLVADFGFRQAVADKDQGTILSALENYGSRIGADRALLLSLNGTVMADKILDREETPPPPAGFHLSSLLKEAEDRDYATGLVAMDRRLYEIALVPVRAPLTIAWVAVGRELNDDEARSLQSLLPAGLDLTFVQDEPARRWAALASTLPGATAEALAEGLSGQETLAATPGAISLGSKDYVALSTVLETAGGSPPAVAVLQYSLTDALAPYRTLTAWMALISAGGLMLVLIGSVFVTRRVTRPIYALVGAARQIGEGDYRMTVASSGDAEFDQLGHAFNSMITRIAEREARIEHQSRHDALTGLPNRRLFAERLSGAVREAREVGGMFSLYVIGLERLAEINATLGHAIGDQVIVMAGERLLAFAGGEREGRQPLLAMHGPGVFLLVMPGVGVERHLMLAQQIVEELEKPFVVGDVNVDASPNVGVAFFPSHGGDARLLLQHAEVALFAARQANSRVALYSNERETSGSVHLSLMGELREGLGRGEFELFYQPKIDVGTRTLIGAEALVRWNHPANGFMTPDSFIPLAERTGQISKLTQWAIREAIARRALWQGAGLDLSVAVNLSARDLMLTGLPVMVCEVLESFGVPRRAITFEITESALMHDPEVASRTLRALSEEGLTLAIDDFGTGYSSLAYLRKLPVKDLKIDKSFVLNLAENPDDRIIVRSIIDLGHNLGLSVTAEGVEGKRALDLLADLGCDSVQGYFVSRPLSARAFEEFCRESAWGLARPAAQRSRQGEKR